MERKRKVENTAGMPVPEVPYENTADQVWAQEAFVYLQRGELQVRAFNTEGVVSAQVWGMCPRCRHELNIQLTLSIPIGGLRAVGEPRGHRGLWAALTRRDVPAPPQIPDEIEAGCGCGHSHPGAPGPVTGCGVSFHLPTTSHDPTGTS